MTSTQTIFSRAVKHHVQDAFVSILDRIDEFNIGAVLVYNDKPRFWRKKELNFSGVQLSDLLEKSQQTEFSFNTETKVLFNETDDSSQRTVNIDLDLDGEVSLWRALHPSTYSFSFLICFNTSDNIVDIL